MTLQYDVPIEQHLVEGVRIAVAIYVILSYQHRLGLQPYGLLMGSIGPMLLEAYRQCLRLSFQNHTARRASFHLLP